jgi:hypothetical protein
MGFLTNKAIENISFNDIQNLVNAQEHESQTLEYKRQSYRIDDLQIKNREIYELLKDVSSFANADGGNIIIGIEQKDNKLGIPEKIINVENAAEEQDRINKLCLEYIKPRITGLKIDVKMGVDNSENKQVILIQIPLITSTLHYVIYQNRNELWKRHNRLKSLMTPDEIKEAYLKINSITVANKEVLSKEERKLLITAAEKGGEYVVLSNIAQLPGDIVLVKGKRDIYDINDPSEVAIYYDAFKSLIDRGYIRYVGGVLYTLTGSGWKKGRELLSINITDFNELIEIADERFDQLQAQCEKKFGRWAIAYQLIPIPAEKSMDELKSILTNDRMIDSNVLREYNGGLEVWLEPFRRYWFAKPFGFFYETRPLLEDLNGATFPTPQGKRVFEWILPIRQMTERILHSIKIAQVYKNIEHIKFFAKYQGLKDRVLWNSRPLEINGPDLELNIICKIDVWYNEITLSPNVETQKSANDLAEIVKSLLAPLYKKFNSFEMPDNKYYEQ